MTDFVVLIRAFAATAFHAAHSTSGRRQSERLQITVCESYLDRKPTREAGWTSSGSLLLSAKRAPLSRSLRQRAIVSSWITVSSAYWRQRQIIAVISSTSAETLTLYYEPSTPVRGNQITLKCPRSRSNPHRACAANTNHAPWRVLRGDTKKKTPEREGGREGGEGGGGRGSCYPLLHYLILSSGL